LMLSAWALVAKIIVIARSAVARRSNPGIQRLLWIASSFRFSQ
jgi:hypothetical protein